jgi:hypothetical protein
MYSAAKDKKMVTQILVPPPGIEPRTDDYKSTVMPFNYRGKTTNFILFLPRKSILNFRNDPVSFHDLHLWLKNLA